MFFDLFILDSNGNLIDVPVLVTNLVDANNKNVNSGGISDTSRLVRRFFVYDTISGITAPGGYLNGTIPSVVRWASAITFKVTLDPNSPEHIYQPYVVITYSEIKVGSVQGSTPVTFKMDYYQDMSVFWRQVLIAFIIFQVVIAVIIAFRLYFFLQQNPRTLLNEKFTNILLFRFFYLLFDVWSGIMFWIIFFTSGYWFITFKL